MDIDTTTTLIRRIFEAIDGGHDELMPELFTDDFVDHTPLGDVTGHEAFRQFLAGFRAAYPEGLHHEVDDVRLIGGDLALWRVRFAGRFTGTFGDVTGTGQEVEVHVANLARIRDGKAAEHWGLGPDSFRQMSEQMGIQPPVGAAATV